MDYKQSIKFKSLWGYIILLATSLFLYYLVYNGYALEWTHTLPVIGSALLVTILFEISKVEYIINKSGITYRFFPFKRKYKNISWSEIAELSIIKYKPIRDYGGWGLRKSHKNGTAYNPQGNLGLKIQYKDGKKLLLATLTPQETFDAAKKHFKKATIAIG